MAAQPSSDGFIHSSGLFHTSTIVKPAYDHTPLPFL